MLVTPEDEETCDEAYDDVRAVRTVEFPEVRRINERPEENVHNFAKGSTTYERINTQIRENSGIKSRWE